MQAIRACRKRKCEPTCKEITGSTSSNSACLQLAADFSSYVALRSDDIPTQSFNINFEENTLNKLVLSLYRNSRVTIRPF